MTHTCLVDVKDDQGKLILRAVDLNERVIKLLQVVSQNMSGPEILQRYDGRLPAGEYSLYDLQVSYSTYIAASAMPGSYLQFLRRVDECPHVVFVMVALESLIQIVTHSDASIVVVCYE